MGKTNQTTQIFTVLITFEIDWLTVSKQYPIIGRRKSKGLVRHTNCSHILPQIDTYDHNHTAKYYTRDELIEYRRLDICNFYILRIRNG